MPDGAHYVHRVIILRKVMLFQNLATEFLQSIAHMLTTKDYAPGEFLFHEGDDVDGMYILDVGNVHFFSDVIDEHYTQQGDFFGELALLDDAPRLATAKAVAASSTLFLSKVDFNHLTNEIPEMLRVASQKVLHHLRQFMVQSEIAY